MKVKVNGKFEYVMDIKGDRVLFDEQPVAFDNNWLNEKSASLLFNNKSYNIEIIEHNKPDKSFAIKVNGNIYHIQIRDQYDDLLKQLGFEHLTSGRIAEIKAPMPGLVLKILVNTNQQVLKGDNLLVLEAMKMENMIKSPTDGVVKSILITTGDKIEKNTVLIQFE
jgi:biotin carboxyl carrier protein